jgi:hypothetical protein
MVDISLGAHEVQYCALLAERRNIVKEVCGIRGGGQGSIAGTYEMHLIGMLGEYAVAKHFGVSVDSNVSLSGDDKITDLMIDGHRVQVKTRLPQKPPLYLFFNDKSLFKADRSVCACLRGPATVQILGWIDRARFLLEAQELNFGYGKRYGVPHQTLTDVKEWR